MPKRLAFTGSRQVELHNDELPKPGKGEVLARSLVTVMSTGTENIVFNHDFEEDTGWSRWVKYPFYPGYSNCGVIEELGEEVEGFKVGDRIATRHGHRSHFICKPLPGQKVPDGVADEAAAWIGPVKICAMGVRAAKPHIGGGLVIVGAGPIGQMEIRWLAAAGAFPLVVVEPSQMRIDLALRGGASHGIAKPLDQAADDIKAIFNGEMPELINDSTGNWRIFTEMQRISRKFGRILLLGDTGTPSMQHLTHDLIGKGLQVSGAHDGHETPEWNINTVGRLFFHLLQRGRFPMDGLTTHTFKPEQCQEAYKTANERRSETMGIAFDWR